MFHFVHIKDYFAVQYLQHSAHGKSNCSVDWLFSLHTTFNAQSQSWEYPLILFIQQCRRKPAVKFNTSDRTEM
ncbi:hypothetical protein BAE44_0001426 [Dichanthelium oligosanthes]|uniref:Uncharacterized protein n=1 Tax=Dichanthelium oligosanthes TaxID=888268 RepID=A0A1E5WJE6_9POAL|nr:hypothetical protein BAE44_0001426 [Dichanthelium oligosanthes]